ncbi:alpha-1,6-mannosyltransferase [Sphingomonas jinjuensis]|uniref:Alpha-1,6-mannosyltransferase n=1 Tax=Sphingomonas jinjuensis TaxID=535907 RepID=A0A840FJ07_9SPHN|nr:glycosyltransferase [Sphingomonas jinjuensis]MBB4153325.1 alpha-1,6-mannosyltransferase [Sphingomonas jinjuensis]
MLFDNARLRAGTDARPLLVCDLTQSYSPAGGGGISTYLREKRDYVLQQTPHHLLQIVPGPADRVTVNGRHIFAEVAADPVSGSPNYRFILRVRAVRELLARYRPDVIESLCPWVLPWVAIQHRRAYPGTALVAGYRTDFPNAHVDRVARALFGPLGRVFYWLSLGYTEMTYREFDWVYTLGEEARATLASRGIERTEVLPLGVDTTLFHPGARDPDYRGELGLGGSGPLLAYAGRIDNEKRAATLVEMFRLLPADLDAAMVLIGDGKLRQPLMAAAKDLPIAFPGFETDRAGLARALASADLYVSAMADETFGISVIEAQAAGLPVVGVASGAMPARVPPTLGRLGPVGDARAMADNVLALWRGDHQAMGRAACAHVEANFSWQATFGRLFGTIYPKALARAAGRMESRVEGGPVKGPVHPR